MSQKKTLRIFREDWIIFSKTVCLILKLVVSTPLKKRHSKSYSKKSYMLFNICKTAYSSQGCVKEHDFWANFKRFF